jgi:hypothetical protein
MFGDNYSEGAGNFSLPGWVLPLMHALTFLMVLVMFADWAGWTKPFSSFENLPDYGIGQRGDVIVSVPVSEEKSARQKVAEWVANAPEGATSTLTGTRDIPVFFQDYDVEAKRSRGAVGTSREGFQGKGDDELKNALAGQ